MKLYRYPENLQAKPKLWFWNVRDFAVICFGALISALCFVKLGTLIPFAATICIAFITFRTDETAVVDYMKNAAHYFIFTQQFYIWQKGENDDES